MEVFVNHFEDLFATGGQIEPSHVIEKANSSITSSQLELLDAPFRGEEVTDALFQMHPTKAPGPDGMSVIFFQTFWCTVGPDAISKVLYVLNNGGYVGHINRTHIVLIPKNEK